jgi:hypothetical protein
MTDLYEDVGDKEFWRRGGITQGQIQKANKTEEVLVFSST